jgi:hypothetical protein
MTDGIKNENANNSDVGDDDETSGVDNERL